MFTGFTNKAGEFLWELAFNNERPWFLEHKEEFEQYLNRPLRELAADTQTLMEQRFPKQEFTLHVSRIYRDARRLFGRGPYKDHLWFSFKSSQVYKEGPTFWFEIGAADYSYGMGFYGATPTQMEYFRRTIDANPARFMRLAKRIDANPDFHITGQEYRRSKGKHNSVIDNWYNRKRIGIEVCRDYGGELFSEKLPETLVDCYEELMPMYKFFMEFYLMSINEENTAR